MHLIDDPTFECSINLIKQFLIDQEMTETLHAFEKEVVQKKGAEVMEMPSILQLVQGFLDLKIKSDAAIAKTPGSVIEFPHLIDSIKNTASVIACASSDSVLFVSSTDKFIRMYNFKDGLIKEPTKKINQDQVVLSMDICDDILLTTGMAGQTQLRNIETGEIIYDVKDHTKYVSSCGFSKDGKKFFTGSHDCYFNVYSLDSKQCHSTKFKGAIESCCMIEDVLRLANI
jgi:WD40 repeat protein